MVGVNDGVIEGARGPTGAGTNPIDAGFLDLGCPKRPPGTIRLCIRTDE